MRVVKKKTRHQGGSKWIGVGGTSPFGSGGYNPEGVRIGDAGERQGRAVKVWEKRTYRNLDADSALETRTMQLALRKLRRLARDGAAEEFDLDATIDATARAGSLDVRLRPERRNAVKMLLFFDVGGSMDPFVRQCETLFAAARSEFKRLEYFYFHNCLYDYVWKDNRRRWSERTPTWDVLHTYDRDYKVVFVGDAAMSPYEISLPGASVEYFNEEAGAIWMQRIVEHFLHVAWINPSPKEYWGYTPSTEMIQSLIGDRMYPLTLAGVDAAVAALRR